MGDSSSDAVIDALTGLPGRPAITRALQDDSETPTVGALLFVDLDRFKWINDSMGHQLGDEVLKMASRRLVEAVRHDDVVARFGGDEFVIIMAPIRSVADTTRLARRIVDTLGQAMLIDDNRIVIGASIGIAVKSDSMEPELLLRQADLALYEAKRKGRGRHVIFDHRLAAMADHRVQIESTIRRAIDEGRLSLHYQPIVSMDTRKVIGFEALARLTDPELGAVSPAEFIPLAGEIGYMKVMGSHLRRQLLTDIAAAHKTWPELLFSFNLSSSELEDRDLASTIGAECAEFGVAPASLTLELSEDMLVQDRTWLERTLTMLRDMGCRISMDDFGTGRASLSSIKRLPIDEIKIDRSFVTDIGESRFNQATCEAILLLANALDATVVAEGIESESEADAIRSIGIQHGQGYLFAKPAPVDWSTLGQRRIVEPSVEQLAQLLS